MSLFDIILVLLFSSLSTALPDETTDTVDLDVCQVLTIVVYPVIISTYIPSNTAFSVDSTYTIDISNAPTYLDTTITVSSTLTPETYIQTPILTSPAEVWTTSTVYKTNVYTVTSCAPTISDCPERMGQEITETVIDYTTVCPVIPNVKSTLAENTPAVITFTPGAEPTAAPASILEALSNTKFPPTPTHVESSR